MNTLILISLAISEFLESLSFSVSINDYFILISIFVLFIFINKNNVISNNNELGVLAWVQQIRLQSPVIKSFGNTHL